MSKDWEDDCVRLTNDPSDEPAGPRFTPLGVPMCSRDECPFYDGKRCRAMGFRPDAICQPVVERMAELLTQ